MHLLVHDEEFFDAMLVQNLFGFVAADTRPRGDEVLLGHDFGDQPVESFFEPQVAVRENADQRIALRDRQPGDVRAVHDLTRLRDGDVRADRDRVGNHSALVLLDLGDFRGLGLRVQIAVDDADPAGLGHRDGRPRLGHRVHSRADERRVQADRARQRRRHVSVLGHEVRLRRQQQNVVERQPFGDFCTGHAAVPRGVRAEHAAEPISSSDKMGSVGGPSKATCALLPSPYLFDKAKSRLLDVVDGPGISPIPRGAFGRAGAPRPRRPLSSFRRSDGSSSR